jgi:hypothetical protein
MKWVVGAGALMLLMLAGAFIYDYSSDVRHRHVLDDLIARRATRADVERALGPATLYAKGDASWSLLEEHLSRQPASSAPRLRVAAARYPKLLYYTTAWRITWIMLDENDVARDFFLESQ